MKRFRHASGLIYQADAFQLLPKLPADSVDFVCTDPPYNISRPNGFKSMGREGFNWGWDSDFDTTGWLPDAVRLMKPGASIVVMNDWKLLGGIAACLADLGLEIKDPLRLEKKNPMPRNTKRRFVSDCEFGLWAVKPGASWVFEVGEEPYLRPHRSLCTPRSRVSPAQKPQDWIQWLLRVLTRPNATVLDPFTGSGTTGAACRAEGRLSIEIEKDPTYFAAACQRLGAE